MSTPTALTAPTGAAPSCTVDQGPTPGLRPVAAGDRTALRDYLVGLGADRRRLRFHGAISPDSDRLLSRLTAADGRRHIALVAVLPRDDGDRIVGEACCVRRADGRAAEFAISVAQAWQGRGLARRLLEDLLAAAAEAGITQVSGEVLAGNARMAGFMRRAGFEPGPSPEPGVRCWMRTLAPAGVPARPGEARGAGRPWMLRMRERVARLARWPLGAAVPAGT